MKFVLLAAVFAVADIVPTRAAVTVSPLSKTIELLGELYAKIHKDGQVAAQAYHEYKEWCTDASANAQIEVKTFSGKQAKLEAVISKADAKSLVANSKIEDVSASIASRESDLKSAKAIRDKEAVDFSASEKELMSVISIVNRAIDILERQMAKNPAALAQVDASNIDGLLNSLSSIVDAAAFSGADKQKLFSLVQSEHDSSDSEDPEPGSPSSSTYKGHSQNIVDVLEDLKEKAEEELTSLRKAESNAKHNYQMLKMSLEDEMSENKQELSDLKATRNDAASTKASAEGDLAANVKDLTEAKETLATTRSNCIQAAADYEASVKARQEELDVIADAKKALSAGPKDNEEQMSSFLEIDKAGRQISRRGSSELHTDADLINAEIVTLVKRLAKEQHSSALAQLASQISALIHFGADAGASPFAKVRQLISDLLTRLEEEATNDASEQAWCTQQMAETEAKKSELEGILSKITTKIDSMAAKSAGLKQDVKELQEGLLKLAQEQAEMDKIREEEHANYVAAKEDLTKGMGEVRYALGTLRDYYGGGSSVSTMLQGGANLKNLMEQPAPPEKHMKSTGAGASIIKLLRVVEADMANELSSEETKESDSASDYEKLTQENSVTKATKEEDVKFKTQEFTSVDKSLAETASDRESTGSELGAVVDYYAKVRSRCIAKPESFEERKKRREAEIAGLREALSILENQASFTQRSKRAGGRQSFLGSMML